TRLSNHHLPTRHDPRPATTPGPLEQGHARARSAASTTLLRSIARVMGPTPPGLGETQPATSRTPGSTSPTTRDLPVSGSVARDTPTSTTTAPGLTMSAVTIPGTPAAATTTSARRVWAARSAVPVCVSVT